MFTIPSPLHPALVHFPIVLILAGAAVAVAAIFLRRWHLPWLAAGLLLSGAAGAVAATWSGEEDGEITGELSPQTEQILDEHEEWGERTRNLAILAGVLAAGGVVTLRLPRLSRGIGIAAAAAGMAASYAVAKTGHLGGLLVYKHGVGVNTAAGNVPALPKAKTDD